MQEVKLEPRTKVRFVIGDKSYEVPKPNSAVLRRFEADMHDAVENKRTLETLSSFLVACGLPQAFVDDLGYESMETILQTLMPQKKT